MKIAFVIHPLQVIRLPFDADGSTPNITYQHATRLAAAGHDVVIYALRLAGQASVEEVRPGVTIRRLAPTHEEWLLRPFDLSERLLGLRPAKRPIFASSWYFGAFAHLLAADLRRQRVDVVYIHNYSQFVPVVRKQLPRARIVLHMHCDWLAQLDRRIVEPRLRRTDLILACSDHVTRGVQARYPDIAHRCRTLHNGVDPDQFARTPGGDDRTSSNRILYVGRVSPEKGLHVLIEAFRLVRARVPDARLDVVGSSRLLASSFIVDLSDDQRVAALRRFYGSSLRERATRLIRTRNSSYLGYLKGLLGDSETAGVRFHGPVPHSGLPRLYRDASVLVNSSLSESFGIPILEAMSAELPCVGVRVGGIPEVISHDETGFIVEPDDPTALADALCRVLGDADGAREMGRRGRARVLRHFTWDTLSEQLVDYLEQLGGAAAPRSKAASKLELQA